MTQHERFGVAPRTAAGDRDPQRPVGPHPEDVFAGAPHTEN